MTNAGNVFINYGTQQDIDVLTVVTKKLGFPKTDGSIVLLVGSRFP